MLALNTKVLIYPEFTAWKHWSMAFINLLKTNLWRGHCKSLYWFWIV